jgi:GNAT superfamily N-acetyltransferase
MRRDAADAPAYEIDGLRPSDAPRCAPMTFPAYRHLLSLRPGLRLPSERDQRMVQPLALVARAEDVPIGLALADMPLETGSQEPELLSLYVVQPWRAQGVATALVEAIEDALRARGAVSVAAIYMTGRGSVAALERIWHTRGWSPPELRTVAVRFTLQEAMATPWYGRMGLLPAGSEIVSWADVTPSEHRQIRESHERAPWIASGLEPWIHDAHGFDPVSSVGLRHRGEVVGWVINHRMDGRTVRFTCSFMRSDLSRRARILPLYSEAIRRLAQVRCELCTMVTPTRYPEMIAFIRRHCQPYVHFTGETRGTSKVLSPQATA